MSDLDDPTKVSPQVEVTDDTVCCNCQHARKFHSSVMLVCPTSVFRPRVDWRERDEMIRALGEIL